MSAEQRQPGWNRLNGIVSLYDIAKGVGGVALDTLLHRHGHDPRPAASDHYRGAAAQLDHQLYDITQHNRWDDMGSYHDDPPEAA